MFKSPDALTPSARPFTVTEVPSSFIKYLMPSTTNADATSPRLILSI